MLFTIFSYLSFFNLANFLPSSLLLFPPPSPTPAQSVDDNKNLEINLENLLVFYVYI